jgi:hypothetical protein
MKMLSLLAACVSAAFAQAPGAFAPAGSMITPRFSHTATLLPDGRVLIAGGYITSTGGQFGSGGYFVCQPADPCVRATDSELYDPATRTFSSAGSVNMIQPTGGVLLSTGKVLFAESYPTGALAKIVVYDPASGEFKDAGTTATLGYVASAAALNDGRVLLLGAGQAEIYDPIAESFSPVPNFRTSLLSVSALGVLLDGRVLLDLPALFNPANATLTQFPIQFWFNDDPSATLLSDGQVLLAGGVGDAGTVNSAELFDGSLSTTGSMATSRFGHSANLLPDGSVLVAGGVSTASAEIYDSVAGGFSSTGSMVMPRYYHGSVLLNNGQVLITGGMDGSFVATASAELYTPATLISAPALFSISRDGQNQGAIWHAATGQIASPDNPASPGEALSLYTLNLLPGGLIPPRVVTSGRSAEILYFGPAPGYPGYYQVNFRLPDGVAPGPSVPVRLSYIGRPSNEVSIGVQ